MKASISEVLNSLPPLDDTDRLLFFLLVVAILLIFVSLFYHPEEEKRPHKAAAKALRVLRRYRIRAKSKSKFSKTSEKNKVLSSLQQHLTTHLARCPYCGTGSPGWQKREVLDLTDTRRTIVISVTAQTCQKCGHVQIFDADWLHQRGEA